MRVLGIDQATHTTGVAIVSDEGILVHHCNLSGGDGGPKTRSLKIYDQLDELLTKYKVDHVAIEDILLNKYVPNLNASRDLCVLLGVILGCIHKHGLTFNVYTANSWKSTIGILSGPEGRNRQAQKTRAVKLVKEKYGIDVDDNQADAICIALAHIKSTTK
jgi:Holliday junction resolvasome RuvABC endonuclease subunit